MAAVDARPAVNMEMIHLLPSGNQLFASPCSSQRNMVLNVFVIRGWRRQQQPIIMDVSGCLRDCPQGRFHSLKQDLEFLEVTDYLLPSGSQDYLP